MRLTRAQRVVWMIFGLGSIGGGVTVGIMSALGAGLGLIIPGFLIFICGSLGKVPNMNLKEGSINFKNIEEPKPVEAGDDKIREAVKQLKTDIRQDLVRIDTEIERRHWEAGQLRKEMETVSTRRRTTSSPTLPLPMMG